VITWVPEKYFDLVWEDARKHLLRAEGRFNGKCTVDDIGKLVAKGELDLWAVADDENEQEIVGAIVTRLFETPRKKIMEIMVCAGDGLNDHLYESMKELENFARLNHCDVMRVEGRKGWVRALKPYGLNETSTIVEKEL